MKKILLLIGLLSFGQFSFGQTMPGGDMETWRNSTAGTTPALAIHAPYAWYGFDSLIIANGDAIPFGFSSIHWYAQLFQENAIKHGGASAAKLLSKKQDTSLLGVPGSLTTAKATVNLLALLSGGTVASATTFSGGTPVASRIMTVSAWVEYFPGIDTTTHMMGGHDTAQLNVQAFSTVHGVDTLVGVGNVYITPCSTFVQVTANVVYADTLDTVNKVRIFFSSSAARYSLDSSTLYVDDVTMTGVPQYHPVSHVAVENMGSAADVSVYPNPSNGTLHIDVAKNEEMYVVLYAPGGQTVYNKTITGSETLDISAIPPGLYFYNIMDKSGSNIQRGKLSLVR